MPEKELNESEHHTANRNDRATASQISCYYHGLNSVALQFSMHIHTLTLSATIFDF